MLDSLDSRRFPNREDLQAELGRANIVEPAEMPPDVVTMNSTVTFRIESSGKDFSLTLVYPGDIGDGAEKVSILAPVGSALLGLREGDEISWPGPGGGLLQVRILKVVYQPERAGRSCVHVARSTREQQVLEFRDARDGQHLRGHVLIAHRAAPRPREGEPLDQHGQSGAVAGVDPSEVHGPFPLRGELREASVHCSRGRCETEFATHAQPILAVTFDAERRHDQPPRAACFDACGAAAGAALWLSSRSMTASSPFWSISAPKSVRKFLT